jgi:hypothetical protein
MIKSNAVERLMSLPELADMLGVPIARSSVMGKIIMVAPGLDK